MPPPIDFTSEFDESKPHAKTPQINQHDLEVSGIEIPPEKGPELVPPTPVQPAPVAPPDAGATSVAVVARPTKRKFASLVLAGLLLVVAGGAAYLKFRPTSSVALNSSGSTKSSKPIPSSKSIASQKPNSQARLKILWNRGVAAKKRGDFAAARAAWQTGLKIEPTNTGFKESLDKLKREGR